MNLTKQLMKFNYTLLLRQKSDISWIVCHYVGALGGARDNAEYYGNNNVGASADFFVGHKGEIFQTNDYYKGYSWHCGGGNDGKYFGSCTNRNSIGIEICVRKVSSATMNAEDRDWYFEDATVDACAELAALMMMELDIDLSHVIRHYDVNYKMCPAPFVQNEDAWTAFKKKISSKYKELKSKPQTPSEPKVSYYRVGTAWKNGTCKNQLGAYVSKENAINACPAGYRVYGPTGKIIYTAPDNNDSLPSDSMSSGKEFKPYRIRITTAELNIREKADSCSLSKGFTGIGTFTIVKEAVDSNNQKWGLLKSYEKKCDGWIALLDICTKKV